MPTTTLTVAETYLHELDIGPQPVAQHHLARVQSSLAAPDAPTASVDKGSLVSFTANLSDQHRSDALNSALLAQLAADRQFNRFDKTQVMNWYRLYAEVLGNIGWTMQDFQFQNYQASGSSFSIDAAITNIVASFLPPAEAAIVKATLAALDALGSGDPWYRIWDQSSHTADGGNFQLGMATDNNGAVDTLVLKISAYAFSTTETTTRFLWENYSTSNTTLQYAQQTATLDEDVYSQVRPRIISKLGANASNFIGALQI